MSQHGRRRAASAPAPVVEDEPVRRFGFLTMESALVLGLVALIVVGSFLVSLAFPSKQQTETIIGDKKVRITTVGKGGVQPGPVQPRVVPVVVPTPVPVRTVRPRKPKPVPTAGPVTASPTPTPTKGSGGTGPLPGGGGSGGGGGGGGGKNECTVLIFCKPGQTPAATPTPAPTPVPAAPQPPGPQQPPQAPPQ